jgi:cytoskeletal protein CcmA (bactofilin family)
VLRRLYSVAAALALLALVVPATASAVSGQGHSDDAVVVVSGDVFVHRGETVDGVFIASGDARIAGRVDGDVVVLSGDAIVSGTIDGELFTAGGRARILPGGEVTGDLRYGDQQPQIALDARVRGEIGKQGWPDVGSLFSWVGAFLAWLAIGISAFVLGALLLLTAPRAADAIHARARGRVGPLIAIGITILIVAPVGAFVAAITLLGLPLAIGVLLAFAPLCAVAYVVAAWALGRSILKSPRDRLLSFLVGLAILRLLALVPILGFLVGLGAVVFGLGLIGAAIGAARDPGDPAGAAQSPGS